MLTDIFKPAWKSSSAEKRLKAISTMNSERPDEQQILTQLASNDKESSIRIAAIQKINSVIDLHEMSLKHAGSPVSEEADKRLNELMSENDALQKQQFSDLLNKYPELAVRIAAHAKPSVVRIESIHKMTTDQLLEVLAVTGFSDSRQLIAEKLTVIEDLESARKLLRGKDKNAERLLKTKIDDIRKQQRIQAENLATVKKLCAEIEYLSEHDWLPEFKAKLLLHRNQWDKLDFTIDPDLLAQYQPVRDKVDAKFEQQILIEQTQQGQQQVIDDLGSFVKEIASRDLASSIEKAPDILTKKQQIEAGWQQLAANSQPEPVKQIQYEKMLGALDTATRLIRQVSEILHVDVEEVLDETEMSRQRRIDHRLTKDSKNLKNVLKNYKWPAEFGDLKVAGELQLKLTQWEDAVKASAAEHQQKLDLLHKKISSIFRFSRTGNLLRAKQICEKVEKGLKHFDGKDRVVLEERYAEAQKTLGDMDDWKNFATEPKYLALCNAMEQLVDSELHPDKLSDKMKELQKQWKALGHSDISDQYWERFKLAADKVYKPCAEFFDERHKIRKAHLQQRQQYVDQMRELLETTDWQNDPDYKQAQSSLRNISDNFAQIKDVEHNAGQKQWKQFSKFKDAVYAKLDVAYAANIKLKHQLIKQTQALAEGTAKEENLATLKTLQLRWKLIGVTKRNQDQKAWVEFKKQGDIVYHNVQQLRQGERVETDKQLNAYREIIKEIQTLAKTAKNLTETDKLFNDLQAKYSVLPELPEQLPEKLIQGIQRDYDHACAQYDNCHSRIINNKHEQQKEMLRMKAGLCEQLEAMAESASSQQLEELSQQWDAIELQDSTYSRRIEQRRSEAQDVKDRKAIAEERRMLCIRLEIAMGVDSPAEDKALRMQYQLEQMNKLGLGGQSVNNREQLEEMEIDWLCMPGAESQRQKELDERFLKTLRSK